MLKANVVIFEGIGFYYLFIKKIDNIMRGNTMTIVRDGKLSNIDKKSLKKDIVVFQTGDIVPADIILTEA